jgi:uroporphyrinogen-III synthase
MQVLITQPEPEDKNSSYHNLAEKYNLNISFVPFISITGLDKNAFNAQKIKILDHTAVIFSSRNSIDHFFRMCSLLKISIPSEMKYFCSSGHVANFLQKYIITKKRKIFTGKRSIADLSDKFKTNKNEKFLIVSSQNSKSDITEFLITTGIDYTEAAFFRVSSNNLSGMPIEDFNILAFFSPSDFKSLFENFPDFNQSDKLIACYGLRTIAAARDAGLEVNIEAPVHNALSMTDALDLYLKKQRIAR